MKKHIDKLKKRSEEDRKRIATIFAGITTSLIVIIWILILVFIKPNDNKNEKKSDFNSLKEELQKVGDFPEIKNEFNFNKLDSIEDIDKLDSDSENKNIE